ncbi:MAG: hypothetical protein JEZ03_14845 [Bacteroidales bacterium]|nr:hypothetical protein [Bacteroidales bacterium]
MKFRFFHHLLLLGIFSLFTVRLFATNLDHSNDSITIDRIIIIGNEKTREHVIIRELTLLQGEKYTADELEFKITDSEEHLRNIELFNFVDIQQVIAYQDSNQVNLFVKLTERWYIWPVPLIESADRNINAWWEQKNFSRLSYGMDLQLRNFRGRRETLHLKFLTGYDQNFALIYEIPYLKLNKKYGMNVEMSFIQNHAVHYQTLDNEALYFRLENEIVQRNFSAAWEFIYRNNIYQQHEFSVGFSHLNFNDSLIFDQPEFTFNNRSQIDYLSFRYLYKHDHRNYRSYPTKGYYFDVELKKNGIGLLQKQGLNASSVKIDARKFWQLNPYLFLSGGVIGFVASKDSPFFMNYGLGDLRNIVRGYENAVIDANVYGLLKSNVKIKLFENTDTNLKITHTDKFDRMHYTFFLNVYSDLGYTQNEHTNVDFRNSFQNTWLMGYGLGLDFVTYYDKVFRLEYSMNKHGGRGVFIHFIAPV